MLKLNFCSDDIITQLLKLAVLNDTTIINRTPYKQIKGLAMGNNLSPILAIIHMHAIEEEIKNRCPEILFWKRYIDDIFVISTSPLETLLTTCNTISDSIKFTLETSVNNILPFLDILVTFKVNESFFETGLYVKTIHSNHILPWDSFVMKNRKIALLKTEFLRAERICNTTGTKLKAKAFLTKRFLSNKYPLPIIRKFSSNPIRIQQRSTNQPIIRIKFPYISDRNSAQIRRSLSRLQIPFKVQPIFKQTMNLKTQLRPKFDVPCSNNCVCMQNNLCNVKNCTYIVTCKLCSEKYGGETFRTLRSRYLEHLKRDDTISQHFAQVHNTQPNTRNTSIEVNGKSYWDTLNRLEAEKRLIIEKNCSLNIQNN